MTLYRLHHSTTYDYAEPVVIGTHFMHLLPRNRPGQTVREAQLGISPSPESRRDEVDHFGNYTTTISLAGAHKQFSVTLSATIEVGLPAPPTPPETPRWEAIAAWGKQALEVAEFCLPSRLAMPAPDIADYAAVSFLPGRNILEALLELNQRIFTEMNYKPGVTNNFTPALQILYTRTGVCQDYAHFMLACLRALGLPGRYVSGYLQTSPPPGQVKRRGVDQSHAWISAWLGPQIGWVDFDPTNNLLVTNEHVTLAWGRDFSDVSPLRGIILGGGRHYLTVGVDLEPVLT